MWGNPPWVRIPLPPPRGPGRFAAVRDCCVEQDFLSGWVRGRSGLSGTVAVGVADIFVEAFISQGEQLAGPVERIRLSAAAAQRLVLHPAPRPVDHPGADRHDVERVRHPGGIVQQTRTQFTRISSTRHADFVGLSLTAPILVTAIELRELPRVLSISAGPLDTSRDIERRKACGAALQARSLALLLEREVSVAYGAADPDFVRSVTGWAFARPATSTAEYARLVRALLDSKLAASEVDRVEMSAELAPLPVHAPVRIGTGVLHAGMASKSRDHADFVVTWLTPTTYLDQVLIPALERADGGRPEVSTFVACAIKRPRRDPHLLVQRGCPHLSRPHYVDMLQRAGLDIHYSDPVSGARELVSRGVFVYGSVSEVVDRLMDYFTVGVDEVVLNLTPVNLLLGSEEALMDAQEISDELERRTQP